MRDANVQQEILRYLDRMPQASQRQVLELARVLASEPKGVPGRNLLRYSGILSPQEAAEMERTIAEGCERIDPLISGGWDQLFADPTLVWPPNFEPKDDQPASGRGMLD